jgi:hypothetical protein
MWQEWNPSFIKAWWKATLTFYLRDTYGTDILFQTFIVAWTFKKNRCFSEQTVTIVFIPPFPPLLHRVTAVRYPAFTSSKILINIFFCPSLFQPFRPSIQPTVYLYVCLLVCLRAYFSILILFCMFTYIHTYIWRAYFMNSIYLKFGRSVNRMCNKS